MAMTLRISDLIICSNSLLDKIRARSFNPFSKRAESKSLISFRISFQELNSVELLFSFLFTFSAFFPKYSKAALSTPKTEDVLQTLKNRMKNRTFILSLIRNSLIQNTPIKR